MTLRSRPLVVVLALALAPAFAGCGSSGDGGLSAAAAARLQPLAQQVRRAAESLDPQGTRNALSALQAAVTSGERSGDISSTRAAQILADAAEVQTRLSLISTTTTTITTTTTTVRPPGPGHGDRPKGGPGKDKGDEGG